MSENENLQHQATDSAFCKYCGARVYRNSPFCPSCGKPLQQTASQNPQQQQQYQQPQQQYQQHQQYQQQYQQPQQQYQQSQQPYYTPFQQGQPLQVTDVTKYHLLGAARWIKVCAVVGAIVISLMVILALWLISKGVATVALGYLIIAGIYLYPIIQSFNFSSHANRAVETGDSNEFSESISNLRGLATFFGIIAIIGVIFTIIAVIGAMSAASDLERALNRW